MEKSAVSHASKNSGNSAAKTMMKALHINRRTQIKLNIQATQ